MGVAQSSKVRESEDMVLFGSALLLFVSWLFPITAYAPHAVFEVIPDTVAAPEISISFVGDMMFDRSVRAAMDERGADHVFSCIREELAKADLVVGNLEGPITDNASRSLGSAIGTPDNFTFTFDPEVAPLLKRSGVDIVSLANNHARDFGRAGIESTVRYLDTSGIMHFGDMLAHATRTVLLDDMSITFIAYNQFGGDAERTLSQVRAARTAGEIPIVMPHWGDEYVPANEMQKVLARRFIDAGAEAVIGAHPHVIQEREIYNGKYIYYSLGNFIFDQYWEDAVRTGLLLTVRITPEGIVGVEEKETYLQRDRSTCLKSESPA